METATLRLFNAIQVDNKERGQISQGTLERTIKNGYLLDEAIRPDERLLDLIESHVGISGEKANAAFHKSWAVVKDSPEESLVVQQMIHYITTYGFKQLGVYREDAVYIPSEVLNLPASKESIPLMVIRAMDSGQILDSIVELGSGIALAQETLDDIMTIVKAGKYDQDFVDKIGNRELKALLHDFYGLVPSEPVDFLRHLISKLTDESLIIKSDYLIEKIKGSNGKFLDVLIKDAPDDLASIFFRFKPLFLAMKSISSNKTFFNQLRKKADRLHAPLPEDYLNSVTSQIKYGTLDLNELTARVKNAGIFRKIRLAYALNHRIQPDASIVYRVRNGRGWATEFDWPDGLGEMTRRALDIVTESIAEDIRENVDGRKVYIPSNICYALPASEKQFTGNLPTGTYVSVPEDLIVGIHWTNTDKQVDLDLSVIGASGKIGWDVAYRSKDRSILFSGDITDAPAPNGASELFYIRQGVQEANLLMVNYFNFQKGDEVTCKLLAACEKPENFGKNYMIDVNNLVAAATINITKRQNVLGLVIGKDGENRVYFATVGIGNAISSADNAQAMHARKYLVARMVNSIDFREILNAAGAVVVREKPDEDYIDLSPEKLDKTTIIDLVKPVTQVAG